MNRTMKTPLFVPTGLLLIATSRALCLLCGQMWSQRVNLHHDCK